MRWFVPVAGKKQFLQLANDLSKPIDQLRLAPCGVRAKVSGGHETLPPGDSIRRRSSSFISRLKSATFRG
jgi:hypothetical protein